MRVIFRNILVGLALAWLSAASVSAANASADSVRQFATDLGNNALAVVSDKTLPTDQKSQKIEALFTQNVDIEWIARFVLGKNWRTATDEQKQRYMSAYKRFLVKNYTARFTDYTNENFKVDNVREEGEGKYYLTMEITRPGQANILLDYRIRETNGQNKIIDIVVEGVSLITTQRSEFASVVSQHGLDYLIEQLGNKNSPLQKNAASRAEGKQAAK